MKIKELPNSELQQMMKKVIGKYSYKVYCHACDRLNIEPLNPDNVMSFGGDIISSITKATEHSNVIRSIDETFASFLEAMINVADNENEFYDVFYASIDSTSNSLKKI
jgi:hypothetical protein